MKTEVCENIPTSSASVTLRSLLKNMNSQMRKIESFLNEKMESLETRIKELKTQNEELETEKENLQRENEKLKSLLAAKERDYMLYYAQYQNIAKEFENFKAQTKAVEPLQDVNTGNIGDKLSKTTSSTVTSSITTSTESSLVSQSIANISNSKPRNILKARKRSRPSISNPDGPSKKISKPSLNPKFFKCSICPKENREVIPYDNINDYRNHVIEIHPKRALCDLCPYNGKDSTDLKRHRETVHSPAVKSLGFDCALCHISYSRMRSLIQHINLYH